MGRAWNPDAVPETAVFPDGIFEFEIESIVDGMSSGGESGIPKVMYKGLFRCIGPEMVGMVGVPYYENYVLGTDDDPNFEDPATIGPGVTNLKRVLKRSGTELTNDLDDDCARARGQHVLLQMAQYTEPPTRADGSPNKYAGQLRSKIVGTYSLGEREVGLAQPAPVVAPKSKTLAKSSQQVQRPVAAAQPAQPARRAPAPAQPQQQAQPKKEQMLVCSVCQQQVARSNFVLHVQGHEAPDE